MGGCHRVLPGKQGCFQPRFQPPQAFQQAKFYLTAPGNGISQWGRDVLRKLHERSLTISVSSPPTFGATERDTGGIYALWSHLLTILSMSKPHRSMRCFWQSSWSARSINTMKEHTEAFIWPVSVKSCVPATKHSVFLVFLMRQQMKAWKQMPPNISLTEAATQNNHPKWIKHLSSYTHIQRLAKILVSSSICLSISKDLLMHQPCSNFPDRAAVKSKLCF